LIRASGLALAAILASSSLAGAAITPKSEQELCAESDLVAFADVTELGRATVEHYEGGGEVREYDARLNIRKVIKGPALPPGGKAFVITRAREAKNFKIAGGVPSFSYRRGQLYLVYLRKGEDGRFYPTWWNGVIATHNNQMNTRKTIC
jgi:hypothetical protein